MQMTFTLSVTAAVLFLPLSAPRHCEAWSSVTHGALGDLARDKRELCPIEPIWCIRGCFCPAPLSATPRHATPHQAAWLLCTLAGWEGLCGLAPAVLSTAITSHCMPHPNIPCKRQWQQGRVLPASNCLNCLRQAGQVEKAEKTSPTPAAEWCFLQIWCKMKVRKCRNGRSAECRPPQSI